MRLTLFSLLASLIGFASLGVSQAAAPAPAVSPEDASASSEPASPVETLPEETTVETLPEELTLVDSLIEITFKVGRVMRGRVVSMDDAHLVLDTFTGLLLTVELGQLTSIVEKDAAEFTGLLLHMANGKTATGDLVELRADTLKLRLSGGAEVIIQRAGVLKVQTKEEVALVAPRPSVAGHPIQNAVGWRVRPEVIPSHRTRYFYAPSAMPLRKGEGYFSQKELIFSAAAFGVTDQMSMLVGSVLPALMFGGIDGVNGIFGLKYAWNPAEEFHVALATEALVLPGGEAVGLGGAVVTFGGYHNHLSLLASVPYSLNGDTFLSGSFLFTVAGALRTGKRWALLTENWVVGLGDGNPLLIGSVGLRRFGRDHAFDFAFLGVSGAGFGFPWVDWTFSWGQRDVEDRRVGVQMPSAPALVPQTSFATWQRQRAEIGLR
jgi:hypothetical protein